jgi:trigger factor
MFVAETENFVRDYDNRLRMQGLDLKTYFQYTGMTLDQLRESLRPQAEKQVKLRLALEKIAKAEKLKATKTEINAEYKRIADEYQMEVDKVRELIPEDSIAEDMKVKKAMDLVKENAIIK